MVRSEVDPSMANVANQCVSIGLILKLPAVGLLVFRASQMPNGTVHQLLSTVIQKPITLSVALGITLLNAT